MAYTGKKVLDDSGCEVVYIPGFILESTALFKILQSKAAWSTPKIRVFGRSVLIPRLQAWYGEPNCMYEYSELRMEPLPWFPELLGLKKKVESFTGKEFNCALLNLYRSGDNHVSWHSDDEPELGKNPTIASVSLGATRRFELKHKVTGEKVSLDLEDGSLLVMSGKTQHEYKHRLSRTKGLVGQRINVTFRRIKKV